MAILVDNGISPDPLERVLDLGARWRAPVTAGALATVVTHAAIVVVVLRFGSHDAPAPLVEIDADFSEPRVAPAPPAPPSDPPAPEAPKTPAPRAPDRSAARDIAPAGRIIEAPADEPKDPYDDGFVTGEADAYLGGLTSQLGKLVASRSGPVQPTSKAVEAPPPAPDRSRQAGLPGYEEWDCDFPSEADRDEIDRAVARISVTVNADGTAQSVEVVRDPGHGFGRAAGACAMKKRFVVALDREGRAITAKTPEFNVRFSRRRIR